MPKLPKTQNERMAANDPALELIEVRLDNGNTEIALVRK